MKHADWNEINNLATKQKGLWSVHISDGLDFSDKNDMLILDFVCQELKKLFTEIELVDYCTTISVGGGLFFFDSEELARSFYNVFEMELTDSSSIYAALYSPIYGLVTENT